MLVFCSLRSQPVLCREMLNFAQRQVEDPGLRAGEGENTDHRNTTSHSEDQDLNMTQLVPP